MRELRSLSSSSSNSSGSSSSSSPPRSNSLSIRTDKEKKKSKAKLWKSVGQTLSVLTGAVKIRNRKLLNHVAQGNLNGVLEILSTGADVHARTSNGYSSLHIACSRGHSQIVKLLLDRGADMMSATPTGATPLYGACEQGRLHTVKILVENDHTFSSYSENPMGSTSNHFCASTGFHPIHIASRNGHLSIVQVLIKHDIPVDIQSTPSSGELNALMLASAEGHMEIVQFLMNKGSITSIEDRRGNNALHYACENGHYHTVLSLLKFGFDPHMPNKLEQTPWDVASINGHVHVLNLLDEFVGENNVMDSIDQAYHQLNGLGGQKVPSSLAESIGNRHPSVINIFIKNRMKYALFYSLGAIREENPIEDGDSDDDDNPTNNQGNEEKKLSNQEIEDREIEREPTPTPSSLSVKEEKRLKREEKRYRQIKEKEMKEKERRVKQKQKEDKKLAHKQKKKTGIHEAIDTESVHDALIESQKNSQSQLTSQQPFLIRNGEKIQAQGKIISLKGRQPHEVSAMKDLLEIQKRINRSNVIPQSSNQPQVQDPLEGSALAAAIAQATTLSSNNDLQGLEGDVTLEEATL